MKSALCYRITKYRIKEVSRMLTHADLLRTLNGTFQNPNQHNFLLCNSNVMLLKIVVLQISVS